LFFFQSVQLSATSVEAANFNRNVNAEENLGEESAEFYSCDVCKHSYSRRIIPSGNSSLSTRGEMSLCEMCVTSFTRKHSAMRRIRICERNFSFNVCNKIFTSHYNLDIHIRVHTGERPYSCEVCKKRFARPSVLITHLRVHTGEQPYSCKVRKCSLVTIT
jgi:hypothetical protein